MVSVKKLLLMISCMLCLAFPVCAKIAITAEIDPTRLSENRTLEGHITILSDANSIIDESSFLLEGRALKTELILKEKAPDELLKMYPEIGDDALVSVYSFHIPGKGKGLYLLPAITAKIDGKTYRTVPSTYEITATQASNSLMLETRFDGTEPLYPGQRAFFTYRISYNRNIELSEEYLPFLAADGFEKIGPLVIEDDQTDNFTIQEMVQEVRAVQPGTFTFGPSVIEGFTYTEDLNNKRVYQKPRLQASAPAITVTVEPFPELNRPESFTGAVGKFTLDATLKSKNEMVIGDEIQLEIEVSGSGEMNTVALPDVTCQPGFSGFFQFELLSPDTEESDTSKSYVLALRPLSAKINSIPSVAFSYFDPEEQAYHTLNSPPIPIRVNPITSVMATSKVGKGQVEEDELEFETIAINDDNITGVDWRINLGDTEDVEISTLYPLAYADLYKPKLRVWHVWFLLAGVVTLLFAQLMLSKLWLPKLEARRKKNSYELIEEAFKHKQDPSLFYHHLEKGFLLLLVEKGLIPESIDSHEKLTTDEEVVRETKSFLASVESRRYGGRDSFPANEIAQEAKGLYRRIRFGR